MRPWIENADGEAENVEFEPKKEILGKKKTLPKVWEQCQICGKLFSENVKRSKKNQFICNHCRIDWQ